MNNVVIVADADALVALVLDEDPHHQFAKNINDQLIKNVARIIFPNTAILEAITALKRGLNQPEKAHLINKQFLAGEFEIEYINEKIQRRASQIFEEKANSKKNTVFDAVIAATAEELDAEAIFSFDNWYEKLGFRMASDLYKG